MVVPLNDLDEQGGSVFTRLAEDLQQVAILIEINEDVQFLQMVQVLGDLNTSARDPPCTHR